MKQIKCPECKRENNGTYIRIIDMIIFKCNNTRCNKNWTESLNSFIKEEKKKEQNKEWTTEMEKEWWEYRKICSQSCDKCKFSYRCSIYELEVQFGDMG